MARLKCTDCGRPQSVCLCPWLQDIHNKNKLIILRHKSEVDHALNTVGILQKCLISITVIDGEIFEPVSNAVLIYPSENAPELSEYSQETAEKTFILLDGTWKKTRKILYLNPWLATLPQIALPALKTQYILRKKTTEGFSTLEAAVATLSTLEKDEQKYQPLIKAMQQMLQFQINKMGQEVFNKHFSNRLPD